MKIAAKYDRLVSFASVHQAIFAEEVLQQAVIPALAVPMPRDIDISCGICLLFCHEHAAAVFELFAKQQIQWSQYYSRQADKRLYEKLGEYEGE